MPESLLQEPQLMADFAAKPDDRSLKNQLNSAFWKKSEEIVLRACAGGKAEDLVFNEEEKLWLNLGLIDEELCSDDVRGIKGFPGSLVLEEDIPGYFSLTGWLATQYDKILKKDVKREKRETIDKLESTIARLESCVEEFQSKRDERIGDAVLQDLHSRRAFSLSNQRKAMAPFKKFRENDGLFKEVEATKRLVEGGRFMNPDEKRAFIDRQREWDSANGGVVDKVAGLDVEGLEDGVLELCDNIQKDLIEITRQELKLEKAQKELTELIKQVEAMTAVEIETALSSIVHFLRDMMKLCANRKRMEPISFLCGEKEPASVQRIKPILEFTCEFDPKLFKNDRINITGKPSVIILPGSGDGMYDWKYNLLMIPTMPYRELPESIYNAIVEYRLDCDEDKILMSSYHRLKANATTKSGFKLKQKFAKEYILFMKGEAQGYKVLPKEERIWFEREIAPRKNEIKVPLSLDPLLMSRKAYERMRDSLREKVESGEADHWECFSMGTVHHYYEEFEDALKCFENSVKLKKDFLDGYFNSGIVARDLKEKEKAEKYFSAHMKIEPQSWWSNVCRDHVIGLR